MKVLFSHHKSVTSTTSLTGIYLFFLPVVGRSGGVGTDGTGRDGTGRDGQTVGGSRGKGPPENLYISYIQPI